MSQKKLKEFMKKCPTFKVGTPMGIAEITKIKVLHQKGLSIRQIAKSKGLSRSRVHRILHKKVSQKVLSRSGTLSHISQKKGHFNYHDCHISISILEKPKGWQPNMILQLKKINFSTENRVNWEEYIFKYNNCSVHLTPHKVIIYPPKSISSISPEDAKNLAIGTANKIIPILERKLEIKLSNNHATIFTIKKNHVAMVSKKIFDAFTKAGFKELRDSNGDLRLILDKSNGEKHVEAVHPVFAESDMTCLVEFLTGNFAQRFEIVEKSVAKLVRDLYLPSAKKASHIEGEDDGHSESLLNHPTSSPSNSKTKKQNYIG